VPHASAVVKRLYRIAVVIQRGYLCEEPENLY
jgi:hypothetical protein